MTFEITVVAKAGGPLTKRISLDADGSLKSDGSACVMTQGSARRFEFGHVRELAALLERLNSHQATALGRLRADLPAAVEITTKRKLNGADRPGVIARTRDYIDYRPGEPAFALVDYDTKGIPPGVTAKIEELGGGLWPALLSVVPALEDAARVMRRSTSAGLHRADTGDQLAGSDGVHGYIAVRDGADIERFLKTLHVRCWLAGLGWLMVGAGGQLLERSVVDRVVGTPERLVFEGAPVLIPPVAQDAASRLPAAVDGRLLDTVAACPPLTILERARFRDLRAKQAAALAPAADKSQALFYSPESAASCRARHGAGSRRADDRAAMRGRFAAGCGAAVRRRGPHGRHRRRRARRSGTVRGSDPGRSPRRRRIRSREGQDHAACRRLAVDQ
jgi:hypothetical protein